MTSPGFALLVYPVLDCVEVERREPVCDCMMLLIYKLPSSFESANELLSLPVWVTCISSTTLRIPEISCSNARVRELII